MDTEEPEKKRRGNPDWIKGGKSRNPVGRSKQTDRGMSSRMKRDMFLTYARLGGAKGLETWGRLNREAFYKEFLKLLPKDQNIEGDVKVTFTWETDGKNNGPL